MYESCHHENVVGMLCKNVESRIRKERHSAYSDRWHVCRSHNCCRADVHVKGACNAPHVPQAAAACTCDHTHEASATFVNRCAKQIDVNALGQNAAPAVTVSKLQAFVEECQTRHRCGDGACCLTRNILRIVIVACHGSLPCNTRAIDGKTRGEVYLGE